MMAASDRVRIGRKDCISRLTATRDGDNMSTIRKTLRQTLVLSPAIAMAALAVSFVDPAAQGAAGTARPGTAPRPRRHCGA